MLYAVFICFVYYFAHVIITSLSCLDDCLCARAKGMMGNVRQRDVCVLEIPPCLTIHFIKG